MSDTKPVVNLCDYIRDIPDFPKPGIVFKDITPLLANGEAFCASISQLAHFVPQDIDAIVGIESRGFLFGAGLSQHGCIGLVPVRKPGKLPIQTIGIDYALEYGKDRLEMDPGAVSAGENVVIVDDLIATGGTALAATELLRMAGAQVAHALFVIDLPDLGGADRLRNSGVNVGALMHFDGD